MYLIRINNKTNLKEESKNIKQLSCSLNSNVDHLSILHEMYLKYREGGLPLSNLMKYFVNGLDDIPTNSEKKLWRLDVFKKKRKIFNDSYFELLEILQNDYGSFKYNFEIVEFSELNPVKFSQYPFWSEFYDYDELEEISAWGFNKKEIQNELLTKTIDQQHPNYSVPIAEFPIERMRCYIKSKFTTLNGAILEGYIMNEGEFYISIFTGDIEHVFTSSNPFPQKTEESLKKISEFYEVKLSDLYELSFETVIPTNKNKRIKGEFKIKKTGYSLS